MDYQKHLFITGFFRSGTSLLTKFLHDLGYNTGGSGNDSINAGFEDEQVQAVLTTFQNNPFSEELILFLEKEIAKIDKIVMKHPRLLFNPNILKIWTVVKPNISVLITYREPLHALESKKSHGNLGYYTNFSPAELDEKFKVFINTCINLRIKHHILYFPDFLSEYDEIYHAISSLGIHIDKDRGRSIWYNLVDFNKVHYGN